MNANDTVSNEKVGETPYAEAPRRGKPVLVVFDKDDMMEWHLLTQKETRIGRDHEQDIALHDDTASRAHAIIHYENIDMPNLPPECRITDTGSRNGTFLNGVRLTRDALLRPGDKIRIGGTNILYQLRSEEEIDADAKLRAMATTDNLTGLSNRAWLAQTARREVDRAQRYQRPMSFILIDLDDFKKINDTYGHPVGDAVLEQFGQLLNGRRRAHDLAARWGGEEFCLLLPETNMQGALIMAERIRVAAENTVFTSENLQLRVTVSIGVAQLTKHDGVHFDRIVERADVALYRAKSLGKNRVCTAEIGDEPTR
ncbi:diguanylate cyclase [bacterium]|nr:diguanylate cyclase [bacterium]